MYNQKSIKGKLSVVMLATAAILAFGPSSIFAQDVATGIATANVLAVLAVSATHDLDFGDVLQGVPDIASKTVIADAGEFQITGEGDREVAMHLQLPDYLWNTTNTDRLVISFSSTDADLDTTTAGTPAVHGGGAITNVDPHNIPETPLGATDNILKIFLGGTVFPTADQRADAYVADIILTVAYTGN